MNLCHVLQVLIILHDSAPALSTTLVFYRLSMSDIGMDLQAVVNSRLPSGSSRHRLMAFEWNSRVLSRPHTQKEQKDEIKQ
jgi:hypothetical protein